MGNICELINIKKSYADHVVLEDINITVNAGEMVAITGKSGSGKTTILNIIGMLEKPDSGTIKLFHENTPRIGSMKANKLLRTKLSYLFQNYALIDNATVNANLEIHLSIRKKQKKKSRK